MKNFDVKCKIKLLCKCKKKKKKTMYTSVAGKSMVYLDVDLTTASVTPSSMVSGLSLLSPPYLTGTTSGATYLFHPKTEDISFCVYE